MIPILVVVGALLVIQAVRVPVAAPWLVVPVGRAAPWGLGLGGLVVGLLGGIGAVRRVPAAALLVLLQMVVLTSCAPPLTRSPSLQARVVALADRLAALPGDPETGQSGATVLLAAWRARVSAPSPAASRPPLWAPAGPEEVSNVP
jgi:hypothetical protein